MGDAKEWAEDAHPRDESGKFSSGGGGGGGGAPDARKWAGGRRVLKEAPMGVRTYGPPHFPMHEYSFGHGTEAEHVGSVTIDADTLQKINYEGTIVGTKMLEDEHLPKVDVPDGHMLVYRLGHKDERDLSNKNAGNLGAVVNHAVKMGDRDMAHGDTIHAYIVKAPKEMGGYQELRGGVDRNASFKK